MVLTELIRNGKFLKSSATSTTALFEDTNATLYSDGYVTGEFLEAIIAREKEFPTGIMTSSMGIALPHVEAKYVKKNALVICTFNPTVKFNRMDKTNEIIDVKIAFILLINEPKIHMKIISELTKIWQNEKLLDFIYKANSIAEIINWIEGDEKLYETITDEASSANY